MRPILLTLVFLSMASPAWAQQSPAVDSSSAPPPSSAPPVDTLPACPASTTVLPQPTRDCRPSESNALLLRVSRIALEAVMGGGSGAMAEAMGAYIGLSADVTSGHEAGTGLAIGTAFGAALGVAPGVWLAGYAMGGDGSFGWTMLGGAVGTALAAGVLAIDVSPAMLALAATIPVAGSIAGYELSSHDHRPRSAPRHARATVVPYIGPLYIGLSGSF